MGHSSKKASLKSKKIESANASENKILAYLKSTEIKPMTSEQYTQSRLNKYQPAY